MNISKIYNADLILSNHYTTICKPYPYRVSDTEETMDLQTVLSICAALCDNVPPGLNNNITLYGINDNNIWRNLVIHTVQFINSFSKSAITLQVENDFLNEFQLQFCKENNIALNVVVTEDINIEFIRNIFSYKPLTKIVFQVTPKLLDSLYADYILLEKLNCQNFDIQLNEFETWTEDEFTKLKQQTNRIFAHIKKQFQEDEIPLVPESFKKFVNRIIIQDYDLKNHTTTIDYIALLNSQCGFAADTKYLINQKGQIFTCCICSLDSTDSLYCGYFDIEKNKFVQDKDEFDIFNNLYDDILDINKKSQNYSCDACELSTICIGDCYSINKFLTQESNVSSQIYCDYNRFLYAGLVDLIMDLDKEKNELFRDFIFGCSFKGCFEYDR